jgi:protein PhnA
MSLETELKTRSNNQCELCSSTNNLSVYDVPPNPQQRIGDSILVCETCSAQLNKKEALDSKHWNCL